MRPLSLPLPLPLVCVALLALLALLSPSPFPLMSAVRGEVISFSAHSDVPFCLPLSPSWPAAPFNSGESSRVFTWSTPLYAKNLTLLVVRPGTLFSLYSWVAKILIQERLGYPVSLLFTGLAFMELYIPEPGYPIDATVAEYKVGMRAADNKQRRPPPRPTPPRALGCAVHGCTRTGSGCAG